MTLTWTSLGADGPAVVRASGLLYELVSAARDRRPRCGLVHAALEVGASAEDERPTLVEMTPVWGQPRADRGVVAEGPVGARSLGRWRFFRYEVRRWVGAPHPHPAGIVTRVHVPVEVGTAHRVLASLVDVPTPPWGRVPAPDRGRAPAPDRDRVSTPDQGRVPAPDQGRVPAPDRGRAPVSDRGRGPRPGLGRGPGERDMWTSNSVVAWVVVAAGLDPATFAPPPGWRAPGWDAGVHAARAAASARPH